MQNAKNLEQPKFQSILLIGTTGTGKTSQAWTLPGKKFAYLFDPNALVSLSGLDIDYEEWKPEITDVDFMPRSVRKDKKQLRDRLRTTHYEPTLYLRWVEDVNDKYQHGFFNEYDALVLDSLTTFGAAVMDRVVYLQNEIGREDERMDYRIAGEMISSALRSLTSLDMTILVTAHHEMRQDDASNRLYYHLMLPGGARIRVPLLFSNIWVTYNEVDKEGQQHFYLQTMATRQYQTVRSSMKLNGQEEVTIENFQQPEKYGIGKLVGG